jgi:hypothetical protein
LVNRLLSTPRIEPEAIGAGVGDGGKVGVIARVGVVKGVLAIVVGTGDGFIFPIVAV